MTILSYDAIYVADLLCAVRFLLYREHISLLKSICHRLGCLKNMQVFSHKLSSGKLPVWVLAPEFLQAEDQLVCALT